jgi:hypothetical protein
MILRSIAFALLGSATIATGALSATPPGTPSGTYCGNFMYSTGGGNSYTVQFNRDGTFVLRGTSTGTWTFQGGFIEVDYAFGGFENQQWYGSLKRPAGKAFGKSLTNGYYYSALLTSGACPVASPPARGPQNSHAK